MDHWTEIRTAFAVAKLKTVSAAAEALGVHRATVNRHIEILETRFRTKLFQRHARGYEPTEAGRELFDVASRADEMFSDLEGRLIGQAERLTGILTVSALGGIASLVMPAIKLFREKHPNITVTFAAEERLAKLEHGEAHVAVRAGKKPEDMDYVVLPFRTEKLSIYASQSYLAKHGAPTMANLHNHTFIGSRKGPSALPSKDWIKRHVRQAQIGTETTDQLGVIAGIQSGLGIGFMADFDAALRHDIVKVLSPEDDLQIPLWIVTHVDLHRTGKVQAFLGCLKELRQTD